MGTSGPLGPILRAILNSVWKRLFDPDPSNPIYLPRVVKDGYAPWSLPSYDPAYPSGVSERFAIPGVPQEVSDSACTSDVPISPIATAAPTLQLLNVMFTNLSVMSPNALTYSATDPQFTAVVNVGTSQAPFTLRSASSTDPNFFFQVPCCEPVAVGSRDCGAQHWNADASGNFVGTGYDATVALVVQLNVPVSGPLTVNVLSVTVNAEPAKVKIDFNLIGQPKWVQQMAEIAVHQGVGNAVLVQGLNSFLKQPDVLENVERLVNNALKNLPAWYAYE